MKYYIKRDLNEYGPYMLADLQRYVAQGNILLTDLTRSEGIDEWVPVSQVMGNIPVPVPAPAAGTVYAGPAGGGYGVSAGYGVAPAPSPDTPIPPDFHWALVLLINYFCGLFSVVWLFVEAAFIKKIVPQSKGILFLALGVGGLFIGVVVLAVGGDQQGDAGSMLSGLGLLVALAGFVMLVVATFTMRSDLEDYYNTTENIHLRLSGVGSALLTFFFAVYYFQWHFSRIAKWKKTGVLTPQSG